MNDDEITKAQHWFESLGPIVQSLVPATVRETMYNLLGAYAIHGRSSDAFRASCAGALAKMLAAETERADKAEARLRQLAAAAPPSPSRPEDSERGDK